jgi:hypothetical protein
MTLPEFAIGGCCSMEFQLCKPLHNTFTFNFVTQHDGHARFTLSDMITWAFDESAARYPVLEESTCRIECAKQVLETSKDSEYVSTVR